MSGARYSKQHRPIRVFISHASADMAFARNLRNLLVYRANATVFTHEDLSPAEQWQAKLRNELSTADIVVALLTPHSVGDSWVLQEIGAAWALKKPILSLITRRDVLNRMPVPLESARVVELSDVESDKNAGKFVDLFEHAVATSHIA